ncbi:MAG: pyruvoyl-dependent arginine decarboxylase [Candidatus Pacearchaeota archaeon]
MKHKRFEPEIKNEYQKGFLFGNRIPKDYFIAKGKGESNITIHAGSYHLALKNAGIEMCNIMTYSSILPSIAREIKRPKKLIHGSVMETIMAVANSSKGERATAGIIFGMLYNKISGEKYGGLVCEYNGSLTEAECKKQLSMSLNELYINGYSKKFNLKNIKCITKTITPRKKYGTSIVALCFLNYLFKIEKTR